MLANNNTEVPVMFYEAGFNDHLLAERKLLAAILKQAIKDAEKLYLLAQHSPRIVQEPGFQADVHALERYFLEPSLQSGGLGFVCAHLDLEPSAVSQWVKKTYLNSLLVNIHTTQSNLIH